MKDIFYFLFGAVFGAILALLFAPQSGQDLRSKIQTTAENDLDKLQTGLEKAHERLDQIQADLQQNLHRHQDDTEDSSS